jgi:hypothetical protein
MNPNKSSLQIIPKLAMISASVLLIANGLSLLLPTIKSQAEVKTQTYTCSNPNARTMWTNTCNITKFDTSLGQLLSVRISMSSTVTTNARAENQDATPRNLDADVGSNVTLFTPTNGVLLNFLPSQNITGNFGAYDGNTDYNGPSGQTYPQYSITDSTQATLTPVSPNFALFEGGPNETIILPTIADSYLNFNIGLAANFNTLIETFASLEVQVIYTYQEPTIPDPTPTPSPSSNTSSSSSTNSGSTSITPTPLVRTGGYEE